MVGRHLETTLSFSRDHMSHINHTKYIYSFSMCHMLSSGMSYWKWTKDIWRNMVKFLHKILWLTCVAQSQEVAQVGGALCVYHNHSLRAQSLFKQVRRTHSPHKSSMLLPKRWCSYQSVHVNHSCGVHGDILTREWLNIPHLTENAEAMIHEYINATLDLEWVLFSLSPLTFPVPTALPLK